MGERELSRLDQPEVTARLFHPRKSRAAPGRVRVAVAPGIALAGQLHVGWRGAPAILFFHGNGEVADDYSDVGMIFRQLGVSFLVMDYRGYGQSDGEPSATTMLADAHAVWRAFPGLLRDAGVVPRGMAVMGRSLGSAPALELAARAEDKPVAVILDSAFCTTEVLLQQLGIVLYPHLEMGEGFDNDIKMAQAALPVLIIHGEEDELLPVSEARELHDLAGAVVKKLYLVERAGHNDVMALAGEGYFRTVVGFLNDLVRSLAPHPS